MRPPGVDVVVVTALPLEFDAVRALLTATTRFTDDSGTRYELGVSPGGARIALALIGPGNLTAAALTTRAVDTYRPRALLMVGVAGSLSDDVEVGDVVVATKISAYHGGRDESSGFRPRAKAWLLSHHLEQLARDVITAGTWAAELVHEPAAHLKPLVSGEVVLDSRTSPVATLIAQHYSDAVAIDMESAGVAEAAHRTDFHRAMTIRGISDRADGAKRASDATGWQPRAAATAAAFAMSLADRLVSPLHRRLRVPPRRVVTLTAVVAATAAAATASALVVFPEGPASGVVTVVREGTAYHPRAGRLPTRPPPTQDEESPCSQWSDWGDDVRAATTGTRLHLSTTSPVTLVDVDVVVHDRTPVESIVLIPCRTGSRAPSGAVLRVDLSAPHSPKLLDADNNGDTDAELPATQYDLTALTLEPTGKDGWVYSYELRLRLTVDGRSRTQTVGTSDNPLRTAFIDLDANPYATYTWDPATAAWIPSS